MYCAFAAGGEGDAAEEAGEGDGTEAGEGEAEAEAEATTEEGSVPRALSTVNSHGCSMPAQPLRARKKRPLARVRRKPLVRVKRRPAKAMPKLRPSTTRRTLESRRSLASPRFNSTPLGF